MRHVHCTYHLYALLLGLLLVSSAYAQDTSRDGAVPLARLRREGKVRAVDTLKIDTLSDYDAIVQGVMDSIRSVEKTVEEVVVQSDSSVIRFSLDSDSVSQLREVPVGKKRFIPNPKKALWLAIVIPGGGQIYNRKYWKLPLIYGGFIGCLYALTWNNTMYRDYSQAYIDIMDNDENTKSYENFISPRFDVKANATRMQEVFRRKKNYYRRYRDLSMFCMIGVYALSIIDAYVDAELSSFDISHDLTMKVNPTVIREKYSTMRAQGMNSNSYGLQCSFNF